MSQFQDALASYVDAHLRYNDAHLPGLEVAARDLANAGDRLEAALQGMMLDVVVKSINLREGLGE